VKVDGIVSQPLAIVDFVVSADLAMDGLRKKNVQAYNLCCHDIEGVWDEEKKRYVTRFWNVRGNGPADLMGLDRPTANRLFEGAKEYIWWLLEREDVEKVLPSDIEEALTP
jgi:hypothetical protein